MVGWLVDFSTPLPPPPPTAPTRYATTLEGGKTLNSNSIILHGFYAANADASARLVHLVVDTSLAQGQAPVAIKAYVSTAVQIAGAPVANVFHQVRNR